MTQRVERSQRDRGLTPWYDDWYGYGCGGFGEVPAEENKVSVRGFKLTLAGVDCAAAVGQRERYVSFGIVQGLLTVHRSIKHELCAYYVCFQFVLSLALCILMFARALSSLKHDDTNFNRVVQGLPPFLMLWLGTASYETFEHISEELEFITYVGIFIVSVTFFLSCFVLSYPSSAHGSVSLV